MTWCASFWCELHGLTVVDAQGSVTISLKVLLVLCTVFSSRRASQQSHQQVPDHVVDIRPLTVLIQDNLFGAPQAALLLLIVVASLVPGGSNTVGGWSDREHIALSGATHGTDTLGAAPVAFPIDLQTRAFSGQILTEITALDENPGSDTRTCANDPPYVQRAVFQPAVRVAAGSSIKNVAGAPNMALLLYPSPTAKTPRLAHVFAPDCIEANAMLAQYVREDAAVAECTVCAEPISVVLAHLDRLPAGVTVFLPPVEVHSQVTVTGGRDLIIRGMDGLPNPVLVGEVSLRDCASVTLHHLVYHRRIWLESSVGITVRSSAASESIHIAVGGSGAVEVAIDGGGGSDQIYLDASAAQGSVWATLERDRGVSLRVHTGGSTQVVLTQGALRAQSQVASKAVHVQFGMELAVLALDAPGGAVQVQGFEAQNSELQLDVEAAQVVVHGKLLGVGAAKLWGATLMRVHQGRHKPPLPRSQNLRRSTIERSFRQRPGRP